MEKKDWTQIELKIPTIHKLMNTSQSCWLNSLTQLLWKILENDYFTQCNPSSLGDILCNWLISMAKQKSSTINLHGQKIFDLPQDFKTSFLVCLDKLNDWGLNTQQDALEALQGFIHQCHSIEPLKHDEKEIQLVEQSKA